jgi:hypothetical protein
MHRFTTLLLLCALVVTVAVAALAPRPKSSCVWFTGWDEPEEGSGKCCFDRIGDRLTITVSGTTGSPGPWLSRDVEGDFVVQVRVRGNFRPVSGKGCRHAGFCLNWSHWTGAWLFTGFMNGPASEYREEGPFLDDMVFLRLERRGNLLLKAWSRDGKKWTRLGNREIDLPEKLKVGVTVEATAPGTFKATFDQFKLTLLGGSTH